MPVAPLASDVICAPLARCISPPIGGPWDSDAGSPCREGIRLLPPHSATSCPVPAAPQQQLPLPSGRTVHQYPTRMRRWGASPARRFKPRPCIKAQAGTRLGGLGDAEKLSEGHGGALEEGDDVPVAPEEAEDAAFGVAVGLLEAGVDGLPGARRPGNTAGTEALTEKDVAAVGAFEQGPDGDRAAATVRAALGARRGGVVAGRRVRGSEEAGLGGEGRSADRAAGAAA